MIWGSRAKHQQGFEQWNALVICWSDAFQPNSTGRNLHQDLKPPLWRKVSLETYYPWVKTPVPRWTSQKPFKVDYRGMVIIPRRYLWFLPRASQSHIILLPLIPTWQLLDGNLEPWLVGQRTETKAWKLKARSSTRIVSELVLSKNVNKTWNWNWNMSLTWD